MDRSLELQLSEEQMDRWLEDVYFQKDWRTLREAAKLLNQLWHAERSSSGWLARQAAANLRQGRSGETPEQR